NFVTHKQQAEKLDLAARYYALENLTKAERCGDCGRFLAFDPYRHRQEGVIIRVLAWGIFCKVRWCPMCAWRKARKLIGELLSVFQQIEQDHKVAYVFLTLTTRNAPLSELRALSAHLSKSWHRLINTKAWRKSVWGYIRAIEFLGDKTPIGQCHPHYHSVLVVPRSYFGTNSYITQAQWVDMWQKALRSDFKPIVDIRGIRPKPNPTSQNLTPLRLKEGHISNPALFSALRECVKYIAKSAKIAKLDTDQFATLENQARGLRQYNLGGLLKEYDPIPPDELDPSLWELLEQEFYRWSGEGYALQPQPKFPTTPKPPGD
uniref:protein rep n=1 Tax=Helicobacter felis TaxID=214 RepID=UPI000CF03AD9